MSYRELRTWVYTCDGDGCDNTEIVLSSLLHTPDGWQHVPGSSSFDGHTPDRVFCYHCWKKRAKEKKP